MGTGTVHGCDVAGTGMVRGFGCVQWMDLDGLKGGQDGSTKFAYGVWPMALGAASVRWLWL